MEKKKDYSLINCIATGLLAYFFTVPFHEFLHFLTYYIYGDKVVWYTAGAVQGMKLIDINKLPLFHKIMLGGGSASMINALIGICLLFIILKIKKMKPLLTVFLIQLMGRQLVQGIGYFMIGGLFGVGDWGNVYSYLESTPQIITTLRIILSIVGCIGVVFIFFILNYMSYYFIENKDDKKERKRVAFKLHLTMLIFGFLIGMICSALSPMNQTKELSIGLSILYNFMWIPFFWGFMFTWIMVKPPKKERFLYELPKEKHYFVWIFAIILILINIFIFGPGIKLHDEKEKSNEIESTENR